VKILIDATLSPRIARALDALVKPAHNVLHVNDLGGAQTTDRHILDFLKGVDDAVVIGTDLDIVDHPHRIAALREWNCPVFLLATDWLELTPDHQAWKLMGQMPSLLKKVQPGAKSVIYLLPAKLKARIRKIA